MNLGDKFTHRITVRLNDKQFEFLTTIADMLGVSPSDYLRMAVNTGMVSSGEMITKLKAQTDAVNSGLDQIKEIEREVGTSNENVKADCDNIV